MNRRSSHHPTPFLLPVLSLFIAAACSDTIEGNSPGGSTGSSTSTGGDTNVGTGGSATGGSSVTGGAPQGTGGLSTGGTNVGNPSGGTDAGTGGSSSGGANAATGGAASGGAVGTGGEGSGGSAAGGDGTGGADNAEPVMHIFLLMGQSNMAGVAKNQPSDRNTDERLRVLGGCNQPAGQWNLANPPLNDCPGQRGWNLSDSVDPGIWFAKTLAEKLPDGHTIGMVGTAESGQSINTFISGGLYHQMILDKIAAAKTAENGRFAGIIFHQGESDNGQETWPGKVVQLYNEVKEAWGVDYDVPFILGELPQGGCCSGHNVRVHEAAEQLPMGYWVSQDGTNVMDEYHFDHASVVLMGQRYGETMLDALGW